MDLSRYEAQPTPTGKETKEELQTLLNNAQISAFYLDSRRQNLELLDRYGKNQWLIGNHQLEGELRRLEGDLAERKKEIDVVNLERQRRQTEVKGEMELLERNWQTGVVRAFETEMAVEGLKEEIREELRKKGQAQAQ